MAGEAIRVLIQRWREDPDATYQSWFLWPERLKNFRSIRRGLEQVVAEIEQNTFGNVYKGSSLETVVTSIAEQRQIFKGADQFKTIRAPTGASLMARAARANSMHRRV